MFTLKNAPTEALVLNGTGSALSRANYLNKFYRLGFDLTFLRTYSRLFFEELSFRIAVRHVSAFERSFDKTLLR